MKNLGLSFTSKLFYAGLSLSALWQGLPKANFVESTKLILFQPVYNFLPQAISALATWSLFSGSLAQEGTNVLNVTELADHQGWVISGMTLQEALGSVVNVAGDVNGDKLPDYMIGSRLADPFGRLDAGLVYLLYGSQLSIGKMNLADFSAKHGVLIQGAMAGDGLGLISAGVGDVNIDGYDDIVVHGYHSTQCHLIFGKGNLRPQMDLAQFTAADGVVIELNSINGVTIGKSGDINHDGISDFLISLSGLTVNGNTAAGAIYVFFGKKIFPSVISVQNFSTADGIQIFGEYKDSVIGTYNGLNAAGNINNDDYDDLMISSTMSDYGLGNLILGEATLPSNISLPTYANQHGSVMQSMFNRRLAPNFIGDLNQDGFDDLFLYTLSVASQPAIAYLIMGQKFFNNTILLQNYTPATVIQRKAMFDNYRIGAYAAKCSDLNRDGFPEFAFLSVPDYQEGIINILYGRSNYPSSLDMNRSTNLFAPVDGVMIRGLRFSGGIDTSLDSYIDNNGYTYFIFGSPESNSNDVSKTGLIYLFKAGSTVLLNSVNQPIYLTYREDSENILSLDTNLITSYNSLQMRLGSSKAIIPGNFSLPSFNLTYDGMHWEVCEKYRALALAMKNIYFIPQLNYHENFTIELDLSPDNKTADHYVIYMQGIAVNDAPELVRINLDLTENEVTQLNRTFLLAADIDDTIGANEATLQYNIINASFVNFLRINGLSTLPVQTFTQGEINNRSIQMVSMSHSILKNPPHFYFYITDTEGGSSEVFLGNITYHLLPTIINNQLSLNAKNETIIFTDNNLHVNYGEDNADDLEITIDNLRGGYFNLQEQKQNIPFSFLQKIISLGQLSFVQDGSDQLPTYDVTASDGRRVVGPQRVASTAPFAKNQPPYLLRNLLVLHEGQMLTLNASNLLAQDDTTDASKIEYVIDMATLAHVLFINEFIQENNTLRFTQADVNRSRIALLHDGSELPPYARFRLSDNDVISDNINLNFTFFADFNDIPIVVVQEFLIPQGQKVVLDKTKWQAMDSDNDPDALTYTIMKVTHGEFHRVSTNEIVTMFTQAEINASEIEFVHDASDTSPEIEYTVSDGKLQTMVQQVPVKFIQTAANNNGVIIGASIGGGTLCAVGLFAAGYAMVRKRQAYLSREGNDLDKMASRVVYKELNIQGVANFKSDSGLKYMAQIAEINEAYQKAKGEIQDEHRIRYSQALANAIKEEFKNDNKVMRKGNSIKFNIADDNDYRPLIGKREAIVERCFSILSLSEVHESTTKHDVPMKTFG